LLLPSVVRISASGKQVPQGTGWFVDSTHVVTIHHVAEHLVPADGWTTLDFFHINPNVTPAVRTEQVLARRAGTLRTNAGDDVTVLELDRPFRGAGVARAHDERPDIKERVVIVGFPRGMLRIGKGQYLGQRIVLSNGTLYVSADMRLDLEDREHRDVFIGGASGSPIFDCEGRVVSVLNAYIMKSSAVPCSADESACANGYKEELSAYPRGSATNFGVPVTGLGTLLEMLRTEKTK
jgi:hypothetical protein